MINLLSKQCSTFGEAMITLEAFSKMGKILHYNIYYDSNNYKHNLSVLVEITVNTYLD